MFIDWLPEVLRSRSSWALRAKRSARQKRGLAPVSSSIETLEQLTLLAATTIFPQPPAAQGEVGFDFSAYSIGDTVTLQMQDIDLAGTGTQNLLITSSAGDYEPVVLTEVGTSGRFVGTIISANSELQGFTAINGLLEVPRTSTISASYVDADDGTGSSNTEVASATFYVFSDLRQFDFSNANGSASSEGFTSSGAINQWHLSTGRGLDLGHSSDDSFYFGLGEGLAGGGTYAANASGTLTSPEIDLTRYSGPVRLTFNTLLNLGDVADTASVNVISSAGAVVTIAGNTELTAGGPGNFHEVTLDLSSFAGQKIRLAFAMQANAALQGEGWYVDDVVVSSPLATIEGTKYYDANGNGAQDLNESPLPGWTIFLDNNDNGILDQVVTTVSNSTPLLIPDDDQAASTVAIANVIGPITDVNVTLSIAHARNSDLGVYLVSPNGTRVELFTNVGGTSQGFTNTTLDDQGNLSIALGSVPYTGVFAPETPLTALNGEDPNGTWSLEVHDLATGQTGVLTNWSLTVSAAEASAVTDASGNYVLTNPSGGSFNVREVPQAGWVQISPTPFDFSDTGSNPKHVVTVPFGDIRRDVDFYNQYILPIITLPNGPAVYTENEPPVAIDSGARVTDANALNFANGTITATLTANSSPDDRVSIRSQGNGTGQISVTGSQVFYQGNLIGTFSGGVGSSPLVVLLGNTPNATSGAVQALLRAIQFETLGDDPTSLTRTLSIVVTDGIDGSSTPVTKLINVVPVNDVPVVTVSGDTLSYPENGPPLPVDIFATVTDADSTDFNGGYLQVSIIGNDSGPSQTTQQSFSSNSAPVPLDYNLNPTNPTVLSPLLVSGTAGRLVDVNVTVNITHTNDAELTAYLISPSGIRVKLFSNVGASSSSFSNSQNFTNTTFDDEALVQILSGSAVAPYTGSFQPEKELFTLDGENPNGTWNLELTDALGTVFNDGTGSLLSWSLDLTLTEVSVNEKLAILNQGQGAGTIGLVGDRVTYGGTVIGTFSGGVGTTPLLVNFNANATPDAVQLLMDNITLEIQGENPILGPRLVEFIVNDGDGGTSLPAERMVEVVSVNDAPLLTLPAGEVNYFESAQPTVLDTFATVIDIDSVDFNSGILTVDLGSTGQATDRLGIRSTSQATGVINLNGSTVRYGTIAIGTFSGGSNGIPLTVIFNSSATPAAVQALVRAITFQAVGTNLNTTTRVASFQVTDGDGGASAVVTKVISVKSINHPPVLALSPASQVTYNANASPILVDPLVVVTDVDSPAFIGGRLTVTLTSGASSRDRLSLQSQGLVQVFGSSVSVSGIVVGQLVPGVGASPMTITFNSNVWKEAVQEITRAVTFQIIGTNPTSDDRIAAYTITDGNGGTSQLQTRRIVVQVTNQPPVNTVPLGSTTSDLTLFDFSNTDGTVDSQGFTSTGTSNLWHLSTGRDNDAGHSSGGSFYFGQNETTSGGGLYSNNAIGTLTSPEIDLTNGSNFDGSVQLTFNTFMNFENVNDTATISVISSTGTTVIASNNGALSNLPDATNGFQEVSLDLTPYVGQVIRIAFTAQTNGSVQREGWYVDDIAVTVPFEFQTEEDTPVAITGLSVADPDASLLPMQVTLSVLHGTITIDTTIAGGLELENVVGNGTNRVILTANQFTINTTLQSLNGVTYQGSANYSGGDQLTMLTSDLGNSGPGGVLTDTDAVFINVQEVFDTATITTSASTTRNIKGRELLLDPGIKSQLGDGQTDMDGAILQINVTAGRNRSDRLRLMLEGKGAGQINTAKGKKGVVNLRLGTLVIGTIGGGEYGKPLKIVFNSNATAADLQHVLKLVTFRTAVETTVYGLRTVTYNFTDALGLSATPATKLVDVVRS